METKSKFSKKCPQCDKDLYYARKDNLENSIKNNRLCNSCAQKKRERIPKEKVCTNCGVDFIGGDSAKYCDTCRVEIQHKQLKEDSLKYQKRKVEELGIRISDFHKYGKSFLEENPNILETLKVIKDMYKTIEDTPKKLEVYKKNCPICGREQIYKKEWVMNQSIKNNTPCKKCKNK